MLLVKPPSKGTLRVIISGVLESQFSRDEILSWYQAVFKKIEWHLPLTWEDGYWYFYSLAHINARVGGEYFLRLKDMEEYLRDIDGEAGSFLGGNVRHLRVFESEPQLLRWPLAEVELMDNVFDRLPTTRGSFERPLSMVEHIHLLFDSDKYLLVRQCEGGGKDQLFLLGTNRDRRKAADLLERLTFFNYIFP